MRDQWDSLLAFKIENFAGIVLILYPILLFLGSYFVDDGGYGAYAFLYGLVVAPICLLVFALCYSRNKSSYAPPLEVADLRREPALAAQGAKSVEERLGELRNIDAEFEDIPRNLKNRYDIHRFIRRASVAFAGFTVMVAWFASFVNNVLGDLVYLAAVLILPYIFTKIYLKSNQTKRYSRLFIKNQRLSLAVFTVENLASATLILYPLALILVALVSKNAEKIVALLLNSSSVISVCILVFAACYFFNPGRYIPQDKA